MTGFSADLGEGTPDELELWPLLTSANVACGGHTGDARSMAAAVRLAERYGVRLGAHPSYPDREHFGRRSLAIDPESLRRSLAGQLRALQAFGRIEHVKPHGALYNDAHRDRGLAAVILQAISEAGEGLAIVCGDRSAMAAAARETGVPVLREAFADRRYEPDGSLVPRAIPGSTLDVAESLAQATLLVREGAVLARDGSRLTIAFDTICIHSDMPGALQRLSAIRTALG